MHTCTNACIALQCVLFETIITEIYQMSTACACAVSISEHTPGNNRICSMVRSPTAQQTTSDKASATNGIPTYMSYILVIHRHTYIHTCMYMYASVCICIVLQYYVNAYKCIHSSYIASIKYCYTCNHIDSCLYT